MIQDVDESLRALVKRDAINGSGVEITFDAPTKDWVARRNAPVVNLYLYDIREDLSRRQTSWQDVRNGDGRVTERRLPPRRYRLSYLVTAWTSRPEDEHRLLSSLLSGFVRHEYFPAELLQGTLEGEETPVLLTVALPPDDERKIADTWSALGGELKPSLDLVVTVPLNIARSIEAGPPVLEAPRLDLVERNEPGAPDGSAAQDASRASSARGTRQPGRPGRPAGVGRVGTPATSEPAMSRRAATAAAEGAPEGAADETFTAGALTAPGRRIRVRQLPGR
jgi:Pvc16 N-terminal domain